MSYFIDWRDYVRQPRIKSLIESKGVEAARQEYMRESNKAMWDDPFVINESLYSSADPTTAAASAGGSSPSIVGQIAEVVAVNWASGLSNSITGSFPVNGLPGQASASIHGQYIDVPTYNGSVDYSYGHVNSTKVVRMYVVSSSNFVASNTTGVSAIVTASYSIGTETSVITGSLFRKFKDAINGQAASAVVAGFTNTIAPSSLLTATINAASSSLTLTHVNKGGIGASTTTFASGTASISVSTNGLDRYRGTTTSAPGILFDGGVYPFTTFARRG